VASDGALLLDPLDTQGWTRALEHVSRDPALRADLIERGYANLKRFSWQRCAQDTLQVIGSLAASQP
jgi:glycosyltransferase involved in cell wall biosynthesis